MKKGVQLVTDIMGTKVKTPHGEDIGVIQNVMVDPEEGTIIYIILCYANFIGKANRHYAIPRKCLDIKETKGSSIYLEIDEEKLLAASGFVPASSYHNSQECVYELFQGTTEFIPKYNMN